MKLPRNAQLWLPGWQESRRRNRSHRFDPSIPVTLHLMFADHFEPRWGRATDQTARDRVATWRDKWPRVARTHRDDSGRPAQWTFFFPAEEYAAELIEPLAEMTRDGVADVEVHIHHDGDGETAFVEQMHQFIESLAHDHGLLHPERGQSRFGFIHGNWALDNSRPDGRWCGLNNELTLLRQLGCYADFTMPAAPDICQTRMVNAIYWAIDDPEQAKSHDRGPLVQPGVPPPPNALLCVQGPLAIRSHPRWRLAPSLDVGELASYAPPSPGRAAGWLNAAPRIGNDVFLKLFTHGAPEKNAGPLLDSSIANAIETVRAACHQRAWRLAHVTAAEFVDAVHRARLGSSGSDPLGPADAKILTGAQP